MKPKVSGAQAVCNTFMLIKVLQMGSMDLDWDERWERERHKYM